MQAHQMVGSAALWATLWAAGCGVPGELPADGGPEGADGGAVEADGGGAADGGAGCDRLSSVRTAGLSLYDQLPAQLSASSSPSQRAGLVEAFVSAVESSGGTPLSGPQGTRVLFFAKGHPVNGYSVAGSWNGWTPNQDRMTQLAGTDLYVAELELPRNAAHAYKLVDGNHWFQDHRSQHAAWDGLNRNSVGEFNAVVYPQLQDPAKGRLVAWRYFHSTALNDARDVFIYVPAAYDQLGCPALPSMYFHDGNEALTRFSFVQPADETYQLQPSNAALLVFVALPDQNLRMSQYTFGNGTSGDLYLSFLKNELVPAVEKSFRVCARPRDRGISGASLGGLISTYAAFQHPEVFGYVGAQSASLFWENEAMVARAGAEPVLPIRFYVDHGSPGDNQAVSQRMVSKLQGKGYEVRHVEEPGGQHDWSYWQKRLPGLLRYFREGRAGCME